jgi:hypothetical protein
VAAEGHIDDLLSVAGRTSVRVHGFGGALPPAVAALAEEALETAGAWELTVRDGDVRRLVDAVDDTGGAVLSANPKRSTLEEYFTEMLDGDGAVRRDAAEGEVA